MNFRLRNRHNKQPERNSGLNFQKITQNKLVQDSRQPLRNWPSVARMAQGLQRRNRIHILKLKCVKDKASALKIYGRYEIKKLPRNLPDTAPVEDDNNYKKLIRKLNNHFLSKEDKQHASSFSSNTHSLLPSGSSVLTLFNIIPLHDHIY